MLGSGDCRRCQSASATDDPSTNDASRDDSTSDTSTSDASTSDASNDVKRNALEWVTFAVGVALTLGVIGFLVYQMVAGSDEPPDLVIELGAPDTRRGTTLVPVTVRNEGDRVAEAAVIEVCAGPDACAELSFTYVPQGSKRTGEVGFEAPLPGPLRTRVVSYRTL